MPKMFKLPAPVQFAHPTTKEPIEGDSARCTFRRTFVEGFVCVPGVWVGHKGMRAAHAAPRYASRPVEYGSMSGCRGSTCLADLIASTGAFTASFGASTAGMFFWVEYYAEQ